MSIHSIEDIMSMLLLWQNCYRVQPAFLPPPAILEKQGRAARQSLFFYFLHMQTLFSHRQILDVKCFTEFSSRYVETLRLLEIYFNLTPVSNPFVIPFVL